MSDVVEYLTVNEVAGRIRMAPEYVSRQCKAGNLQAKKLGTKWRISSTAVDEFMAGTAPAPVARHRTARQRRRSAS